MSDRTSKISTLDRFISYFSPTFGIKRIRAKAAIDAFAYGGGGYTGAKTRHGLSNTVSVGDDTDHSLSKLRSYSRSLVTYTTIGAGAVFLNASNTIGSGLKMQPSIVEGLVPLSKKQIEALQTQIKQRWKLWAESTDCDYNGQFTFNQLQFLIYLSKWRNAFLWYTPRRSREYRARPFLAPVTETIKKLDLHFESEITAYEVNSLFGLFIKTLSGDTSTILDKTPITRNPESPVLDIPDYSLEPGVALQGIPPTRFLRKSSLAPRFHITHHR